MEHFADGHVVLPRARRDAQREHAEFVPRAEEGTINYSSLILLLSLGFDMFIFTSALPFSLSNE